MKMSFLSKLMVRLLKNIRPNRPKISDSRSLEDVLTQATRVLFLVCIVMFGYILFNLTVLKPRPTVPALATAVSSDTMKTVTLPVGRTYEDYGSFINERNIFGGGVPTTSAAVENLPTTTTFNTSHLKLVGIVLDKNPTAVIEDTSTNQTLFVSIGQRVGDMVLKEVQQGKAIFTHGNSKIELTQ